MALSIVILFAVTFVSCDGHFKADSFHKELAFADQMCPLDQVDFQTVTKSAVSCVRKCSEKPGCRSLVYLSSNKTCFGIRTDYPLGASSSLLGAIFYTTTTLPTTTPQTTTIEPGLDCSSYSGASSYNSDIYQLWMPQQQLAKYVVCDVTTDGGGWLVIQRRFNGSVSFNRTFSEYEEGFGDLSGEFWMGLRDVHALMTCGNSTWEVRFDLEDAEGLTGYQTYQDFRLASPPTYTLQMGQSNGTAIRVYSESFGFIYNNGRDFSAYDYGPSAYCGAKDRDRGGWWYGSCTHVNINGEYLHPPGSIDPFRGEAGMIFRSFDSDRTLKSTEMKIRRVSGSGC